MSQQVQELINKIKREGVQEAESKARQIEEDAQKKAQGIVKEAEGRAEQIMSQAQKETEKMKQSGEAALRQAARDMLLKLRTEMEAMLQRIIAQDLGQALAVEQLSAVIGDIIKTSLKQDKAGADLSVAVSPESLEGLKKNFLAKLQDEVKKKVSFHSDEDIEAGFAISYDGGKSSFDFSDESLVAFLSQSLNDEMAKILSSAQQDSEG